MPDYVEDLRLVGGDDVIDSLAGGAQMYLDTWSATRAWQALPNLAQGRSASASTTEWTLLGRLKPPKAVDGDTSSRWASEWRDQQWFRVDLGSAQTVGKVTVRWEAAHARDYDVQVSTDGSTWHTVGQVRGSNGDLDTVAFAPTSARHIRLDLLTRATSYGFSIHELEVYAR